MPYEFKHRNNVTFEDYLTRHEEWGWHTFGTPADGRGPKGPLDHLKKEVNEIAENPFDLEEWTDAIILSIDGFLRAGGKKHMVLQMLLGKQSKNAGRNWPDWKTSDPDKAIEHVRTPEELAAKVPLTKAIPPAAPEPDIYKEPAAALYAPYGKTKGKKRMKGGQADDR